MTTDPKASIVIHLLPDGSITCSAPKDLLVCYGLLEAAKDICREMARARSQEAARRIAVVSSLPRVPPNGQG